jgi:arylformamidase
MKLYDISMAIREDMQVYKNKAEKRPELKNIQNFQTAKNYETRISMDAHTGTHVDAPLHMIENGATIETLPLESLVGPARVLDLTQVEEGIGRADLEPLDIRPGEWLLFKTRNSLTEEFDFNFVYLKEDGARYLREIGIKGVGTDGLGIERAQPEYGTHRTLMGNGITVVEGLRLKEVPDGHYFMVIAPLKLEGIEAAPARALLLPQDSLK